MIVTPRIQYSYEGNTYTNKRQLLGEIERRKDYFNPAARFWYFDEIYGKEDWTKEPDISLDDLYTQRAKQLRDQYDYIILNYSGGADSHQILSTFLKNNIFIDEVQTHFPVKMLDYLPPTIDESHPLSLVYEYALAAKPGLKQLAAKSPKTKIVVHDVTPALEDFDTDNYLVDFGDQFATHTLYHAIRNVEHLKFINESVDKRITKQKVCSLYGTDKPNFMIMGNNLLFYFTDFPLSAMGLAINKNINHIIEPFFWSPNCPQIPIKQGHIFKQLIEKNEKLFRMTMDFGRQLKDNKLFEKILYKDLNTEGWYQSASRLDHHTILLSLFQNKKDTISHIAEELDNLHSKGYIMGMQGNNNRPIIASRFYQIGQLNITWNKGP
jgi:hypothetical protein